jgi:hypothetical protein
MRETTMMRQFIRLDPQTEGEWITPSRRHVGSGRLSTPLMNAVVYIRRQNPPEHL